MLLCPADDPQVRPRPSLSPFHPPADPRFNYPFSYTFSIKLARRKLGSVRNPSMKLMLVDEDEGTIHAGSFFGDRSTSGPGTLWESMLANRHDPRGKRDWRQWPADVRLEQARRADKGDRGNVAFVDGHVDYVTREFTWDERHYRRELH